MKSVFRFLGLGVLAATFTAAGVSDTLAQNVCDDVDGKQATYKKFTDNFDKAVAQRKLAVEAAKEYIEKYGACADDKAQVDYLKNYIPETEKLITTTQGKAEMDALYSRFNTSLGAKNWDEVYASGKEVLAKEKDPKIQLDVAILLGSIGLDEAIKNNDKYNADTVKYALEAIQKIESGATSDKYGAAYKGVGVEYKNAKFSDGKNNALGWLNYTVGYIKYFREKNKKDALPFLYKATQYNSATKGFSDPYAAIGQYYLDEIVRLDAERKAKAVNNVETDETKAIYALQKGYADRGIDALARAYKLIGTTPAEKAYRDSIYAKLKGTYEFRNNGKADGMDAAIASIPAKPMPNPTTEVTPVVEVAPATTTSSANTSSMTAPAAAATPVSNATTDKTSTAATATKTPTAKTAAATAVKTTKAPVKKPAPKKKGTR
ncbi:MAG: hypothetical protein M3Q99_12615 [Acidobacteriota bacterium]|nr:hypothetical protein [Acidobacteriota bacterium]